MDNAATAKMKPEVLRAMEPYLTRQYYNPSANYEPARKCRDAVENARESVARVIGAKPEEIFFTSGGTEADNWAIFSCVGRRRGTLVTSAIEHHAVLHAARRDKMVPVELVGVDCHGVIDLERLKELLLGEVCLVSIMAANNEIGTVEPLKEISRLTGAAKVPFHSDAVQAFGQIPLSVKETGVDMLSGAAHKLGGPKGVGFLYVREEMELLGMIKGGEQERGKRAGTENVAGIVGFGKACEMAMYKMEEKIKHETMLRDYMIHEIEKRISGVHLNGSRKCRLPNNIHFTFDKVRGDALLALLEEQGILASAGSACNSSNTEPSHVLTEIGLDEEAVRNSLRFTIQPDMKIRQIDYVVDAIVQSVHYLRSITP